MIRLGGILDRYVLRTWSLIFLVTTLGFPLIVIAIELTDELDEYLARGLRQSVVLQSYVYSIPEKVFMVLPAAVLFATVFTIGAMDRHSELTAAKATGRSFGRIVLPVFLMGMLSAILALGLGEMAPPATRQQMELLGERQMRSINNRYNFVFRADQGWVYLIRSVDETEHTIRDLVLEREGSGAAYPTLAIQAFWGRYADSTGHWTLGEGRFRIIGGEDDQHTFAFDSMYHRNLVETPAELLAEPKAPEEMRYFELGRYIDALERSGGDVRKLKVDHALKIAIPMTCLLITIFAAPLAISAPRAGAAWGVAVSLATTILFLTLIQLFRAVGSGGLLPPALAAWMPNLLFGGAGAWLMRKAPT